MRGDLGAIVRAAENPKLGRGIALRIGAECGERVLGRQRAAGDPGLQIAHVGGELRRAFVGHRVERERGAAVGARRAAQAEVDAPRRNGVEHAELLGHLERRVVRQHHPGAAHPDAFGGRADRGDKDFRRGAEDGRVIMML